MSEAQPEVEQKGDTPKGRPVSGDPHPDVYIIEAMLRKLKPGEQVTKEVLAASIGLGMDSWEIVFRRVQAAQRRLRNTEGINVQSVHGVGYRHEPGDATIARVSERERKSIQRKAKKNVQSLANVDTDGLTDDQKFQHNSSITTMAMTRIVNSHTTQKKMIAAATVTDHKRLPMADALNVLRGKDSP